jgi:hypothetical protein
MQPLVTFANFSMDFLKRHAATQQAEEQKQTTLSKSPLSLGKVRLDRSRERRML